jgi:lipid A ethanolaminephosphotransferase
MRSSEESTDKQLRRFHLDHLRPRATATVVNLVAAVFLVCCANGAFWRAFAAALESSASGGWVFPVSTGMMLVLFFNILLSLLAHPVVHKTSLVVLIVLASITDYFMGSYGIVINRQMITNLLETDFREAGEFFTWDLFRHVILLGVLPAVVLVWTQIRYRPWRRELLVRTTVVMASVALFTGLLVANFKEFVLFGRNHRVLRAYVNPTYPIFSFVRVLQANHQARGIQTLQVIASDATRPGTASRTAVVYVVGESARAELPSRDQPGTCQAQRHLLYRCAVVWNRHGQCAAGDVLPLGQGRLFCPGGEEIREPA